MPFRVRRPAEVQRDPAREQRSLRRGGRTEGRQPLRHRRRVRDQPARPAPRGDPRLDQHQPGMRLVPGTPLPGEQPHRDGRARERGLRLVRQPGRPRGHQQQLRLAGGLPADPVQRRDRPVRLRQRLGGQPRRHQHLAAPDGQHERRRAQLGVPLLRLVQQPQRRGHVTGAERREPPALHRVGLVVLLARGVPQRLRSREVGVGPLHRALRQVHGRPQRQRPRRPDHVVGLPQHRDRPPYVLQRLAVPAEHPPHVRPSVQHPRARVTAPARHPPLERGQPRPGASGVHQRDPERGQDVRLPLGRLRAGGEVAGAPQMGQRPPGVAEVPLPDADHLMGDRCVQRRGIGAQHLLSPRQRFARGGEHHRQQFQNRVVSRCHPTDGSAPEPRHTGSSLYQSAARGL
ncbi:hypothetical protein BZZ08_02892 [Streptomyces sp. MH60]|nr:hypothetical protein BZZ08_02892 [Streptomyces sp. MH60]